MINIAVFEDKYVQIHSACAYKPVSAEYAAGVFNRGGCDTKVLDRFMLANPSIFNAEAFDVVYLPYGNAFPAAAVESLKRFFADGGRIITCGGFAFRDMVFEPEEEDAVVPLSSVVPETVGDGLSFNSFSMPLFDVEHTFASVSLKPSPTQTVFTSDSKTSSSGYSAVAAHGGHGRYIPLLDAYDADGVKCGTAGAMIALFPDRTPSSGYWGAYTGTSIAFFGVENIDLLSVPELADAFAALPRRMLEGVYIEWGENRYDCYRQGETPLLTLRIASGRYEGSARIRLTVADEAGSKVFETEKDTVLRCDSVCDVAFTWENAVLNSDFFTYCAEVYTGGERVDIYETGFSVWNDERMKNSLRYVYEDNYVKLIQPDGSKKTIFITGVDDSAGLLVARDQTPLEFLRDMRGRMEAGVCLYENLQQYRGAEEFRRLFADPEKRERHYRKVDNIIFIANKFNQLYMMGLAIGDNVAVTGDALALLGDSVEECVKRYADVPCIIWYLNGDLVCRIGDALTPDLRRFLKDKYKTDENFRRAWKDSAVSLSTLEAKEYPHDGNNAFGDVKASDYNDFRMFLIRNWNSYLIRRIRAVDRCSRAILCEFYSWPCDCVDIPCAIGELTYGNIGFFASARQFPSYYLVHDQRSRGKGMGVGEFGKRTNPLFKNAKYDVHWNVPYNESKNFFWQVCVSGLVMGGNHMQIWCWSDGSDYVFPWGLTYGLDKIPRDWYYWMRAYCLWTKTLSLTCPDAPVALLTPDRSRHASNAKGYGVHFAVTEAINALQYTHQPRLMCINEYELHIPESVRVIFYPLSFFPPENVLDELEKWVEEGGTLYMSGDFAYDEYCCRTRSNRMEKLAGISIKDVLYTGTDHQDTQLTEYSGMGIKLRGKIQFGIEADGCEVVMSTNDARPVVTMRKLKKGRVFFNADLQELFVNEQTSHALAALYEKVLSAAGVEQENASGVSDDFKLFSIDLADGGSVREVYNTSHDKNEVKWDTLSFDMTEGRTAFVTVDSSDAAVSLFADGRVMSGEKVLYRGDCHMMAISFGGALEYSKSVVVMPLTQGNISLRCKATGAAAYVIENAKAVKAHDVEYDCEDNYITLSIRAEDVNKLILLSDGCEEELARKITSLLFGKI